MKTVHKFPLTIGNISVLHMPAGATVLHVGLDPGNRICLWAFVDTDLVSETRIFTVVGTGHEVPDGLEYIGSVVQGPFVWHVFEK